MIRISDTEIGYNDVLFRIKELVLEPGKVYALIGSNGRGKTTFLKTLSGIQHPLKGKVQLLGKDLRQIDQTEMSKMLAFVTPRFEGIDHLSVFDFILLGRTPYLPFNGRPGDADVAVVEEVISAAQLGHLRDKYTSRISDGERQLASVCRALAQQTDVILLDEPSAFLDYPNKIRVMRLLKKMAAEKNKCILLSSHDLELCLQEELSLLALTTDNELIEFRSKDRNELIRSCFVINE